MSCAFAALISASLPAQQSKRNYITGNIDDRQRVALRGNVRPEVTAENDRGLRDSAAAMTATLLLHRSAENDAAFKSYLEQLQDRTSPNFHKWLGNAEIGERFGPSTEDIARVGQWLVEKGFAVHQVAPDGSTIEFDRTVGKMVEAQCFWSKLR